MKYVNDFLEKSCSSELMALYCKSRSPMKEISESYAAYRNLKSFINMKDPNKTYLFVGDGSLCMTGALFSFLTKGLCVSVDPLANTEKINTWATAYKVQRFLTLPQTYQTLPIIRKPTTIVLVHAHVNVEEVLRKTPNWDYVYTNPCCHPDKQTLSIQQQESLHVSVVAAGTDEYILSDKKDVYVYKNNNYLITENMQDD